MTNENPFELSPEVEVHAEQAFAEANERLDAIINEVQEGIARREKQFGVLSDASSYLAMRDFIQLNIVSAGPLFAAVVCAAAIFRLAHPQHTEDLETAWNLPTKDADQ